MIERTSGIALRLHRLTETSLIIHWLTPSGGRIATVAKGALRPKSPFHGKLDLFFLVDLTFSRSRRSDLHTLREVSLLSSHSGLRQDLGSLQQASYCAALIEQTTESDTPLPEIFSLFRDLLQVVSENPPASHTVLAFELKLLHELGLAPNQEKNRLTPAATALLKALGHSPWNELRNLNPGAAENRELRQYLHAFLIFHLGRLARGRQAALDAASHA